MLEKMKLQGIMYELIWVFLCLALTLSEVGEFFVLTVCSKRDLLNTTLLNRKD